jgi:hypothetical protein
MQKRFWMQWAIAVVTGLVPAAKMRAASIAAATVQEAQYPSNPLMMQYTVNDNSTTFTAGGKFDIALFLSTTTGNTPTTTNANWTAESVDSTAWATDMTGESLTWQQYTGLTYTQAFPSGPIGGKNGYFLDYNYNGVDISFPSAPILPGGNLSGFFFTGSPSSMFFVAGPSDGTTSFAPGSVVTYSGTSTDTPEPTTLGLIALCGIITLRRRGKRLEVRTERRPS